MVMIIGFYILSLAFTLLFGIVAMSLFDLDAKLKAIYLLSIYPLNLLFYIPGVIVYFVVNRSFYFRYKLILMISPNFLCFLFWFCGAIVYNYLYSKVDFRDFVIFGV